MPEIHCNWGDCCCKPPSDSANARGVVYVASRGPEQFVLLSTPYMQIRETFEEKDLKLSTITLFYKDPEGKIRAVLHHEPHDVLQRMSLGAEPDEKCDLKQSVPLEDFLPEHLKAPIMRFAAETLDGVYFQMHGLFSSVAKLIRTMPLSDSNGRVVAGLMIIGPLTFSYDNALQQFVINERNNSISEVDQVPPTRHLGRVKKNLTL